MRRRGWNRSNNLGCTVSVFIGRRQRPGRKHLATPWPPAACPQDSHAWARRWLAKAPRQQKRHVQRRDCHGIEASQNAHCFCACAGAGIYGGVDNVLHRRRPHLMPRVRGLSVLLLLLAVWRSPSLSIPDGEAPSLRDALRGAAVVRGHSRPAPPSGIPGSRLL